MSLCAKPAPGAMPRYKRKFDEYSIVRDVCPRGQAGIEEKWDEPCKESGVVVDAMFADSKFDKYSIAPDE